LLELAVAHDPVRYRALVRNPHPKLAPPTPAREMGPSTERGPPPGGSAMEKNLTFGSPVR